MSGEGTCEYKTELQQTELELTQMLIAVNIGKQTKQKQLDFMRAVTERIRDRHSALLAGPHLNPACVTTPEVTGDQWWMFYRYNHDALYGWGTLDEAKTYLRAIDHDGVWSFCEVEPDSDLWQRLNDPNNNLGFDIWAELY